MFTILFLADASFHWSKNICLYFSNNVTLPIFLSRIIGVLLLPTALHKGRECFLSNFSQVNQQKIINTVKLSNNRDRDLNSFKRVTCKLERY